MTNHINNADTVLDNEEYVLEYQDGEYVKVYKPYICGYKVRNNLIKYILI